MTELTAKYRMVFGNAMGQEVLADILVNRLKFGCYLGEALGDIALYNAAIGILNMAGIIAKGNGLEIIKALQTVTPKKQKEVAK